MYAAAIVLVVGGGGVAHCWCGTHAAWVMFLVCPGVPGGVHSLGRGLHPDVFPGTIQSQQHLMGGTS